MIINPYIYGPPVKGNSFYGRSIEVNSVLEQNLKQILFVATRRMGKTSLMHHIDYLTSLQEYKYKNVCIYWNLQGNRDVKDAKRRLSIRRIQKKLPQVNWQKINKLESSFDILDTICETFDSNTEAKNIILMIDEPDLFGCMLERKEFREIQELKDAFDDIQNLRVVIVGPPRTLDLYTSAGPSLLDNFQVYYIKPLSRAESEKLIKLENITSRDDLTVMDEIFSQKSKWLDNIIELANGVPFFIQNICGEIFNHISSRKLHEILEEIIKSQRFNDYFTSDFSELHPIEKFALLILVQARENLTSNEIIDEIKNKVSHSISGAIPTQKYIDNLGFLNLLRKSEEGKYKLASKLFEEWIVRDFDNLWYQTNRKIDYDKKYSGTRRASGSLKTNEIETLEAEYKTIGYLLDDLLKKQKNGEINEEFYFKKVKATMQDNFLLIFKIKNHLISFGAIELSGLLDISFYSQEVSNNRIKLPSIIKEAKEGGWEHLLNFTDADDINLKQTLAVVFNVARHLINN